MGIISSILLGMRSKLNKDVLPIMGIVAFSGCSVNAVANLFLDRAKHGTPLFWAAAVLVELTTAWLVWSVVETTRKVTKSNISKQDRRFHSIILTVFLVLAIPSLSVSVVANVIEFGGDILLGLLFPTLSVACAVGAGLPQTVRRHESQGVEQRALAKVAKTERAKTKARQEVAKALPAGQRRLKILSRLCKDPTVTTQTFAKTFGVSEQSIRNDLRALAKVSKIKYKDGKVTVPLQLVKAAKA